MWARFHEDDSGETATPESTIQPPSESDTRQVDDEIGDAKATVRKYENIAKNAYQKEVSSLSR
jgi:hypothetical protein